MFSVTIDTARPYHDKPAFKREIGAITRRLESARAIELGERRFCNAVRLGYTWVGGTYEPDSDGWGDFKSQQLFAIDVDNDTEDEGGGKRPLKPWEPGYLEPRFALLRCHDYGWKPLCMYATLSAGAGSCRYRIVFDAGEPITDEREARDFALSLLADFPEADQACKNPNRLFAGSNGSVWELWRCWDSKSPLQCDAHPDCWVKMGRLWSVEHE